MEENKKRAMKETDPVKKAALISQIEQDGLLLQQKYQRKKELSDKFKWDPKKKVDDLIEAMKRAIKRSRNKGPRDPSEGGGGHHYTNPNGNDSDSDDNSGYSSDDDKNNSEKGREKEYSNFFKSNQQLILVAGAVILIIFLLYSPQKETSKSSYNYDF